MSQVHPSEALSTRLSQKRQCCCQSSPPRRFRECTQMTALIPSWLRRQEWRDRNWGISLSSFTPSVVKLAKAEKMSDAAGREVRSQSHCPRHISISRLLKNFGQQAREVVLLLVKMAHREIEETHFIDGRPFSLYVKLKFVSAQMQVIV